MTFNAETAYRIAGGSKALLEKIDPNDTGPFKDKDEAKKPTERQVDRLGELQQTLYAEGKQALLVILQGMDTSGKDGTIRHVFKSVDPQGCAVAPFKAPSAIELAHDFLWRIHAATPPYGMIHIFNRSHYESVLVERVLDLTPAEVWSKRYDHINAFERMLIDERTTIVKFFLHISKDEQKQRLQDRIADADKRWKFDVRDLDMRKRWNDFQRAYEDALTRCSTPHAPWHVIPSNRKWYRNWAISDILVRTLERMNPRYPRVKLPKKLRIA